MGKNNTKSRAAFASQTSKLRKYYEGKPTPTETARPESSMSNGSNRSGLFADNAIEKKPRTDTSAQNKEGSKRTPPTYTFDGGGL